MSHRLGRACALGLTLLLPLTACSATRRPAAPSGTGRAASARPVGTTPSPVSRSTARGQVEWWPAGPPAVTMTGLVPHSLSHDDPGLPTSLRWVDVPEAEALNHTVAAWATDTQKDFLADKTPSATAPPELTGEVAPVLASGHLVGVRAQLRTFFGANGQLTHRTWYADSADDTVWTATDLVDPVHLQDLAEAALTDPSVRATAGAQDSSTTTTTKGPVLADLVGVETKDAVTDLWFTATGDLVMGLDQGTVLAASQGAQVLTVPRRLADPYLSDVGRRVQAAFTSHDGGDTPGPTGGARPTPTPGTSSVDCGRTACVALTFDDGPGPYTATLLDELQKAKAKATFFVIGQAAAAAPDLVRREVAMGMTVGNHTWDHRQLTSLTPTQQADELNRTSDVLRELGVAMPPLTRPPYGSFNPATRTLGMPLVLWNVDTEDWKNLDSEVTTRRALEGARAGSIVLLHDVHASSVRAVPGIVEGLRAKGLTPVTVPELLAGAPEPGKAYFSGSEAR